jgi:hypothetical protein
MVTEYRSKEEWYEVVARFESAERPAKEFCRREGLSYWTFCGWHRRKRDENPPQQLVEVAPVPTAELECAPEERELTTVLRALRGMSCRPMHWPARPTCASKSTAFRSW